MSQTPRHSIQQTIIQWISDNCLEGTGASELDAHLPLDQQGVLDSVGVLKLVSYLEDRYSVSVEIDDFIPENFATVSSIASLIDTKSAHIFSDGRESA